MKDENKELLVRVLNRLDEIENRLRHIERVLGVYPPKKYSKFPYDEKKGHPYRYNEMNNPVWPQDKDENSQYDGAVFKGA